MSEREKMLEIVRRVGLDYYLLDNSIVLIHELIKGRRLFELACNRLGLKGIWRPAGFMLTGIYDPEEKYTPGRFTLDPNFLAPVPEELPTIEELEWYQRLFNRIDNLMDQGVSSARADDIATVEAQALWPFSPRSLSSLP